MWYNTHMFLPVDPSSGIAIYRQIQEQVRRMIVAGTLQPGDRVPSARDLAETLEINYLTVTKAYRELVRDGVLENRRGRGMFVAPQQDQQQQPSTLASIRITAQRLALEAQQAGMSRDQVGKLLDQCWQGDQEGINE